MTQNEYLEKLRATRADLLDKAYNAPLPETAPDKKMAILGYMVKFIQGATIYNDGGVGLSPNFYKSNAAATAYRILSDIIRQTNK